MFEKKKYFVVSDVHSFYDEMMVALSDSGFDAANPNHIFVCLGDLLDRGPKPIECLTFVNSIPRDRKILIRGNHEDLLDDYFARGSFRMHDMSNGTMETVRLLAGCEEYTYWHGGYKDCLDTARNNPLLREYFFCLQDYAEIGQYIFVHGWIPSRETSFETDWRQGNWREARWMNGMEQWRHGNLIKGKTIVCGHWHTSWGHSVIEKRGSEFGADADFSPFVHEGIIAIDACTAYSHKINCFMVL